MNQRIERTVFLSYRRTNFPWAHAIYQNLTANGFDVFFDVKGIASGDFESVIVGNIRARAHFLVLLTPSALERCGDPGDWLRREIEAALETRRNIVPVMLDGFDFGTTSIASQLTGKLAVIKSYNAIRIPSDYFDEGMERLRARYLNIPLEAVLHPASIAAKQAATEQQKAADVAPAVQEKELTAQQYFERAFNATDPDEKIRLYSEAIRLKPDYADAFYNRGVSRHNQGDNAGAIKDYSEAIRLKPDYAAAFNNRGSSRKNQGDHAGAIKDYSEAIRLKPDYAAAFNNRGISRHNQGDHAGAIKDYSEAIRLKPDYADAFYNRGVSRQDQGDHAGAIKDYSEAIRLKPDYADAFYNRGVSRQDQGDHAGAIKDYSEAIRLKPDYAAAFNNRGVSRTNQGDHAGAIKDYSEAIRLKPDYAAAFENRSISRKKAGDLQGAEEDLRQAKHLRATGTA